MPTPVGHAIGGLAAAWFAGPSGRKPAWRSPLAALCAAAAVFPDVDILFGSHRTYTHSFAAVVAAGVITWLVVRHAPLASRIALTVAAAYASHLLLDWLGRDSSTPPGLMALWPFSTHFYISVANLFGEVSRRYWKPDEFIVGNFLAVGRELLILGPIAAIAYFVASRRRSKMLSTND